MNIHPPDATMLDMATMQDYRTVTPYLVVSDADGEIAFLERAFGATVSSCSRNEKDRVMHAEVRIGDSLVMVGEAAGEVKALNAAIYLWVESVDETYRKAMEAGAKSLREPQDQAYGHRNAGVVDANEISWWIGSPTR